MSQEFMESSLGYPAESIWKSGLKITVFLLSTHDLTGTYYSFHSILSFEWYKILLEMLAATSSEGLLSFSKI
jgi:hypothetical protein